jgi:hypothetical protein
MATRLLMLSCTLATAAVLASCGEGALPKSDYEARVRGAVAEYRFHLLDLDETLRLDPRAIRHGELNKIPTALGSAVRDLEALEPPAAIEAEHLALVDAARGVTSRAEAIVTAARESRVTALLLFSALLTSSSVTRYTQALVSLEEEGYEVTEWDRGEPPPLSASG